MNPISTSLEFLTKLPLYEEDKPYILIPSAGNEKGWKPDDPRLQNLSFSQSPVLVHDMRRLSSYSLSSTGFQSFEHEFKPFKLEKECVLEYRRQTEDVLKQILNAEDVICYDFRHRKNEPLERMQIDVNDPLLTEGPPTGVHDLTPTHAPSVVRPILTAFGKEHYLKGWRLRIVNTWRPLVPKLEDRPLAVCDFRSVDPDDVIAADRIYPHRATEFFYLHHNPAQRWYWLSGQTPRETIMMLMFDTHCGNGAKFCPHVSFPNPLASPDAPPRESVETRSIVITKA
ncbi:hypothetical protein DV735_g656, partial [Chaetothyriales sp. CBS 134920]